MKYETALNTPAKKKGLKSSEPLNNPTLIIKDLSFARLDRYFFKNLNITLHAGEILQVEGENGSGKSTLLRILAGLIEPLEGNVFWENQCIFQDNDIYKNALRYLSDRNALKSYLTVEENLTAVMALCPQSQPHTMPLRTESTPANIRLTTLHPKNSADASSRECWQNQVVVDAKIEHLLKKQVQHLSFGQLRRVSFARILLNPGKLWILDEPMTGLDRKGQDWLNASLEKHLSMDGMIIIATHQPLNVKNAIKTIRLGDYSIA